ncbi:FAD-dependent monooxygenase [Hymenobacter weizhouensis]|uniref:FAD-dependent monooxygenase n=1 Tax=Hymenobacter sp. YIM 151500-1 TaxID=2987689 RepID=UPI002226468B|nr:FAD-dependent monooxygenase [Hymenobacter sp. YIM 151500-1]UYZ65024.1 FAD-dependent monooxygenase [Hymenobacter sp. YIM 151500-1]
MAHFLVIGAGIGGLTTALALRQAGHEAAVYEAAPKLREMGAGLVLGANTMQALQRLGLAEAVASLGEPLHGLTIFDEAGRVLLDVNAAPFAARQFGQLTNIALRHAALQHFLLRQLRAGTVHTGKQFTHFTLDPAGVTAHFADGSTATADALVAADGLHSRVRRQLLPEARPRYAGYTCWRAVVDASGLNLPRTGRFQETWGRAGRFGYVPVGEGLVYWFGTLNSPQPQQPDLACYTTADLRRLFAGYHAPVADLLHLTPEARLLWHDIVDLPPLRRYAHGRVLLLGDAAHATTPNLGQGAGQAVEDAVVLGQCVTNGAAPEAAFREFERRRRHRTHRIVSRSWRVGQVAQWQHPALIAARNALLRLTPRFVTDWQTQFIYRTRF